MNRERAEMLMSIFKQIADDTNLQNHIQEKHVDGDWREFDGAWMINDSDYEYRIKPEPRKIWIHDELEALVEDENPDTHQYVAFRSGFAGSHKHKWRKFVEVTDD